MTRAWLTLALAAGLCSACSTTTEPTLAQRVQQVTAAETAFAQTMADRNHAAFLGFVADEAVFLGGGKVLRGKAAVGDGWKRFFTTPQAPFAWMPDHVEVLSSGTLAHTKGPVRSAQGELIGRFYSTWRLDPDGHWRVVFDDGYDICKCQSSP